MVTRTEQHIIKKNNSIYKTIDELCFKSKNVYNYANYLIRQEFINNKRWIKYNELASIVKDSEFYKNLGSNVGQQTLKILDKNWKSFFISIKDWCKNPSKYLNRPKLPKYKEKDGRFILGIDNIKCAIKDGYLRFSWKPLSSLNGIIKTNIQGKLIQVRFVPKGSCYILEIVYEKEVNNTILTNSKNICGIDLGLNNFATLTNNIGLKPIVINGKPLKSMNQYYNKMKAKIQSELMLKNKKHWSKKLDNLTLKRNNKIKDYMHITSKFIINYCIENNIDTIVIGNNQLWKQESNMNKKNNQNFVSIPFEILINQLQYKGINNSINIIVNEESYTSGTSFLDGEIPIKENYDKKRRIYRGLFKSNNGDYINSDVNGSYQIIKKVFPNAFANGIEGAGSHPVIINLLQTANIKSR